MNSITLSLTTGLNLATDLIVLVGATALFYWLQSSWASPFVVAHRRGVVQGVSAFYLLTLLAWQIAGGFAWRGVNLLIVGFFLLARQSRARWQPAVDAGLLIGYAGLGLAHGITVLGLVAAVGAGVVLIAVAAVPNFRRRHRWADAGFLALFAASVLMMQATRQELSAGLWAHQLGSLAILGGLVLAFDNRMRRAWRRSERIAARTRTDELTGVQNFGTFRTALERLFADFTKNQTPYAVFEGDLDHFKSINDTFGHPGGNEVLRRLALELDGFASALPFPATAYRLGGEEFAIIAEAKLSQAEAQAIGERFLALLKLVHFTAGDATLALTCSIGQARVQEGDYSAEDGYKRADRNLYLAKRSGRNCVRVQPDAHPDAS
ncbi:GGDEF domain-containing protein [Lacticaseibacillus kribbianus]|uniref:GGDEF domain-containing protein n=1 Tax=Lacticaseibacillus kribbianus TaxID=2926292 RepID=UPI001CD2A545|nr:GGDEF domain-containing protein [Lacticaseibacillus kribbianus]